jgi:sialidase-1
VVTRTLLSLTLAAALLQSAVPSFTQQDLATAGAGSPFYRIPALAVTTNGTLLAAYDARPTLGDLPSPIALVMRRSTDNGRTWLPQFVVRQEPAPEGVGDPSLLVDRVTGRVFLFHAAGRNQGFFGSHTGNRHDDPDVLQADVSYSDDDGLTWTHRRITSEIKDRAWGGIFASSGQGIQLRYGPHAGRLVQQYVVRFEGRTWAASAYSDDHGDTWRMGRLVGPDADENKSVELSDGTLMLNIRAKPFRKVALSRDGGATWTGLRDEEQLIDPANNASIIRVYPEAPTGTPEARQLLFSNTESRDHRENLTLRLSCDNGATWPVRKVVEPSGASYSTLARLPDGRFGLLYERGSVTAIAFATFNLEWLGGGCGPSSPIVTAQVKGRVFDEYGASIPDASVAFEPVDPASGLTPFGTVTDSRGRFDFIGIHPGTYRVTGKALGFETTVFVQEVAAEEDNDVTVVVRRRGRRMTPCPIAAHC